MKLEDPAVPVKWEHEELGDQPDLLVSRELVENSDHLEAQEVPVWMDNQVPMVYQESQVPLANKVYQVHPVHQAAQDLMAPPVPEVKLDRLD